FLVPLDELTAEPAEYVVGDRRRISDVGILGEARRLEALVSELLHQTLERHAVLQGDRGERRDRVHQSADRAPLLVHLDEELARLTILEHPDGEIALMARDLELVI